MNKSRNINGYRTSANTLGVLTIQATACLFYSLFLCISKAHFLKIRRTYLRLLLTDWNSYKSIHYLSPPQ